MQYPARLTPDSNGGFVVTFRDVPEAITQGDTVAEALEMAADALLISVDFYLERGVPMPHPSAALGGEFLVTLLLPPAAKSGVAEANQLSQSQRAPQTRG